MKRHSPWNCSVACADLDVPVALLALYEAAPVELASAPLHPPLPTGGVAAVAAQKVAPVQALAPLEGKGKKSKKVETLRLAQINCDLFQEWIFKIECIGPLLFYGNKDGAQSLEGKSRREATVLYSQVDRNKDL